MKTIRTIAIIGTGAVGGYYGALLQRSGLKLHYLLRSDFEQVAEHGMVVESPQGDFRLPEVAAYDDPAKMPPCDLAIVSLKTTANNLLPDLLPPVLKDDGLVLTLQNGLGSEETVAACSGPERILGGLCFLCSNKIAPGHIRHLDYGLITLGDYRADGQPAGITPRLQTLSQLLQSAGITARPVEDLLLARWKKLVWNIPFNGLTVVHGMLTDRLLQDPAIRRTSRVLMEEVAEASAACARPIEAAFIDKMMADTEKMTPYAPSMKLDFDRGRPMEIDSIYGEPLRQAHAAGVAMPETERLYRQLRELQPHT